MYLGLYAYIITAPQMMANIGMASRTSTTCVEVGASVKGPSVFVLGNVFRQFEYYCAYICLNCIMKFIYLILCT